MKDNIKIYYRKDGRYEKRYHYGYNENGISNYKSAYGSSEIEVIEIYNKIIDNLILKKDLLIY